MVRGLGPTAASREGVAPLEPRAIQDVASPPGIRLGIYCVRERGAGPASRVTGLPVGDCLTIAHQPIRNA